MYGIIRILSKVFHELSGSNACTPGEYKPKAQQEVSVKVVLPIEEEICGHGMRRNT